MSDDISAKPKGKRNGRGAKSRGKVSKPTAPATGRGRRTKAFESLKLEAIYERFNNDLKPAINSAWKLLKPALNELGDRTIAKLKRNPRAIEEAPETEQVEAFLQERWFDQLEVAGRMRDMELAMIDKVSEGTAEKLEEAYRNLHAEACDQQHDRIENQLNLVEHALQTNLPFEVSPPPLPPLLYARMPPSNLSNSTSSSLVPDLLQSNSLRSS